MARLPSIGNDDGMWGSILNDYLLVSHAGDGTLKQQSIIDAGAYIAPSNGIPLTDLSVSVQNTLTKADTAIQSVPVLSVAGRTGAITVTKSDVGLSNVDNTNDLSKPISTQTQLALDAKAAQIHSHAIADIINLQSALDAKLDTATLGDFVTSSDLTTTLGDYATSNDLSTGLATKANTSHIHTISDVTSLQSTLDTKVNTADLDEYTTSSDLSTGLASKADTSHTHNIADITSLQSTLDAKANVSSLSDYVTSDGLTTTLDDYATMADVTSSLSTKADTASLAAVATSGSYNDLTDKPTIPQITVSSTAPSSPSVGDLWVDLGS